MATTTDTQQPTLGEAPPSDRREQPVGALVSDLMRDLSLLVRQEVELARAELAEKGRAAATGAALFAVAAVIGLAALGALTAGLVLVFATFLDSWLAALLVGAGLIALAGLLAVVGRGRLQEATPPVPEQTLETVKEDVRWVKERARSGRR